MLGHLATQALRIQAPADQGNANCFLHEEIFADSLADNLRILLSSVRYLLRKTSGARQRGFSAASYASSVCALFRAFDGDPLRHEHGPSSGSLSRSDTELELPLIELINDLAHGCLIQIG
jgi:hypothetical protein